MKKRTPTQIKNIILEFHKSGLTQAEFCCEHSLSISTFHNWLRKNRDIVSSKPLPNFSFVEVMEETSLSQPAARTLRISTSYGLLLEIPL